MSLARKALRAAVQQRLKGEIPAIGPRVYAGRVSPVQPNELPCILLHTLDGTDVYEGNSPVNVTRTVNLRIQIFVKHSDQLADEVDVLSAAVEAALFLDESFGGRFQQFVPQSWNLELLKEGEYSMGVLETVYSVSYHEDFPDITTGGVDFETVSTDIFDIPDDGISDSSISITLETTP